jgi:hypothetical protein
MGTGPQTVCRVHTDAANAPWLWCANTAFSDFNPDTGGMFVLPDLKLVICFPPGSLILIPSGKHTCTCVILLLIPIPATFRHTNLLILACEDHFLFTQYIVSGFFRHIACRFKMAKQYMAEQGVKRLRDIIGENNVCWMHKLQLFSHVSDFIV